MKNQEHTMNTSLDKMLKPVTDPLKTLVNSNVERYSEKTKNMENSTLAHSVEIESDKNNSISSTKFNDYYEPKLNSAQLLEQNPKSDLPDNLEISLEGDDIHGIYDGVSVPFGIRSENRTLLMGNSVVSFSKIDSLNKDLGTISTHGHLIPS
ncbi:unnamed protein product [Chrysodeixis includens]|uniref:Uncharacterized protein n=1 Tax=Chrysodeixis includens TaxID=689277 RepID=A0A9N8Q0T9_CHRIL|nr:unnamed protein product [Chrysodeixis includens]